MTQQQVIPDAATKAQMVAALWKRTKHYDWHTDEIKSPGNLTIIFRDQRAQRAMSKALAIILKRKQVVHNGGKP